MHTHKLTQPTRTQHRHNTHTHTNRAQHTTHTLSQDNAQPGLVSFPRCQSYSRARPLAFLEQASKWPGEGQIRPKSVLGSTNPSREKEMTTPPPPGGQQRPTHPTPLRELHSVQASSLYLSLSLSLSLSSLLSLPRSVLRISVLRISVLRISVLRIFVLPTVRVDLSANFGAKRLLRELSPGPHAP